MTVITEADLRDQLRRPVSGARVVVPAGARLSPAANDFIAQWKLQVETGGVEPTAQMTDAGTSVPAATQPWQHEAVFPVAAPGDEGVRCTCCGSPVAQKGDNLTQLNAHHFVVKTHPRIRLRGQVDSLHAWVLLTESYARHEQLEWLGEALAVLAAYCRELTSAEYNERPVADLDLPGWDMEQIHRATHDPQGVLGVPHATLNGGSPILAHWLNVCRTQARELELTGLQAFDSPHHPYGASINHALNRLSSAFYFLQLRLAQEAAA